MFKKLVLVALLPISLSAMEQEPKAPTLVPPSGNTPTRMLKGAVAGKLLAHVLFHGGVAVASTAAGLSTGNPAVAWQTAVYLETVYAPTAMAASTSGALIGAAIGAGCEEQKTNNP